MCLWGQGSGPPPNSYPLGPPPWPPLDAINDVIVCKMKLDRKTKLESVLVGAMLVLSWHWVRRCNSAMAAPTEPKATQSKYKNSTNVLTMVGAHALGVLEVVGKLDAINQ